MYFSFQKEQGITYISSNDFSYYDGMLDTAVLFGAVPACYRALNLNELDTYFAMARGYRGKEGDVKALAMKKWFNTNYHYMVPEISDDTKIELVGNKPFALYQEAKELGVETKPVIVGPFTFLKLAKYQGSKKAIDFVEDAVNAYSQLLDGFNRLCVKWVQFDELALKEKLPIRKSDWYCEYLDWAIPAFRLCHSGVKPETQIHTHMCYSEFDEIIKEIDKDKLWVNPDCGLKTRGIPETEASLKNLVEAARIIREQV